ncbi:MAG: hypothetical protein ABSF94_02210 [Steroidobacteraceae bacterium]
MNHRLWALMIVAFLCSSVAADFSFTRWAIYQNASGDAGRLYHLMHENADEVPVFGASKAYYDYVPAELGLNVYNYGLDGSGLDVVDAYLEIELAKQKTTPIIIDLEPEAVHDIGDVSAFIPFAFDPRIRRLLDRSNSMIWRFYVPGVRYFGYYDYYLKEFINDRVQLMRKVDRGFSYEKYWAFDRARLDDAVRKRLQGPNGYFPDEKQNARLIERVKQHPERIFFLVYSPVHASCFANFQNLGRFDAFKAQLSALPNAVVIDDQRLAFRDQWFKDTHHLLHDGAVEFSRKLSAQITEALYSRRAP